MLRTSVRLIYWYLGTPTKTIIYDDPTLVTLTQTFRLFIFYILSKLSFIAKVPFVLRNNNILNINHLNFHIRKIQSFARVYVWDFQILNSNQLSRRFTNLFAVSVVQGWAPSALTINHSALKNREEWNWKNKVLC